MATLSDPARHKVQIILQVRSGQLSAAAGAKLLGLSRKSYYRWERRALKAMIESLRSRPPGRPRRIHNPVLTQLQRKIRKLEQQLQTTQRLARLRGILRRWDRGLKKNAR